VLDPPPDAGEAAGVSLGEGDREGAALGLGLGDGDGVGLGCGEGLGEGEGAAVGDGGGDGRIVRITTGWVGEGDAPGEGLWEAARTLTVPFIAASPALVLW
jgi:hypothetical protein